MTFHSSLGCSSNIAKTGSKGISSTVVGSSARAIADRGPSSSIPISPNRSLGSMSATTLSRRSIGFAAAIASRPRTTRYSAFGGSPLLKRTSPRMRCRSCPAALRLPWSAPGRASAKKSVRERISSWAMTRVTVLPSASVERAETPGDRTASSASSRELPRQAGSEAVRTIVVGGGSGLRFGRLRPVRSAGSSTGHRLVLRTSRLRVRAVWCSSSLPPTSPGRAVCRRRSNPERVGPCRGSPPCRMRPRG